MRTIMSTQRPWTRGVAVSALVLGMATVVPTQAGAQDSRALAAQHTVAQKNLQFNPFELTVAVGDTVTWTNHETDGSTIHSVVQQGGSEINSPDIPAETSFSWTFTQVQDYNIVCRFHPDMFMTLHVLDAKAAKAANKGAKPATGKKAPDESATKKTTKKGTKKPGKKAAPMATHDAHDKSAAKSVPAPPPGPPDSTIPGVGGLPLSLENGRQR